MGLVGGRILILLAILILIIGVGVGDGYVSYKADGYRCSTGRRWYAAVPKQRLFAIGSLNFEYQPLTFGCDAESRYDASKYHMLNGELVPIHNGYTN